MCASGLVQIVLLPGGFSLRLDLIEHCSHSGGFMFGAVVAEMIIDHQ